MKKVLILIPDGVGLRNFIFTDFYNILNKNAKVIFWNLTPFDLEREFGIEEIISQKTKNHPFANIVKKAKQKIELDNFSKQFDNSAYLSYLFQKKQRIDSIKSFVKTLIYKWYLINYNKPDDNISLFNKMEEWERKTDSYKKAKEILMEDKPDSLFVTNQRVSLALPIIVAAKDLDIPVYSFIFSWDNLPKATMVINADYYFVWSEYMKKELMQYYPHITEDHIFVTGTPQFEPHFDKKLIVKKKLFFKKHKLNPNLKYILFSGDDITTSPYDQYYLRDLAESVRIYNKNNQQKYGIILRKCPTDFTGRYQFVIDKYKDIVFSIDPLWKKLDEQWNKILPMPEDWELLVNTLHHSEWVINVGSSMVFDAVLQNKPNVYINYNADEVNKDKWNIGRIYNFIHFSSMPSKKATLWANSKDGLIELISFLDKNTPDLSETKRWLSTINTYPYNESSKRMAQILLK